MSTGTLLPHPSEFLTWPPLLPLCLLFPPLGVLSSCPTYVCGTHSHLRLELGEPSCSHLKHTLPLEVFLNFPLLHLVLLSSELS